MNPNQKNLLIALAQVQEITHVVFRLAQLGGCPVEYHHTRKKILFLPQEEAGYEKAIVTLSDREAAILRLIKKGYKNRKIAAELGFQENTVGRYISNIFKKMNVESRTQALL